MGFPTVCMADILRIIKAEHADPHTVLGMREVVVNGSSAVAVRVMIPSAARVFCTRGSSEFELDRVHEDGFFEGVDFDAERVYDYKLRVVNFDGDEWETCDPYSFAPVLTPFDLQLFGEGTHYEIYNKLGGHLIEVGGVAGAHFAVWAPSAKRVSVIGQFNMWDPRRHQMRELGTSGVWEIFIPGLKELDSYKFSLMTHTGATFEKTDPYARYFEPRPGTSARLFDIALYEWGDGDWQDDKRNGLKLNVPLNVYEVHLGSWKRGENGKDYLTYDELAEDLAGYAKDMGYTHVEFMPVMEHPFDGSWGYQLTGYFAPTCRFGDPRGFMKLVDSLHQNGIGVILDWAPAHFASDDWALANYDGSPLFEHEDPRKGSHPQWGTLVFNYGRNQVKNFLIGSALFWLDKFHADGLRVDGVSSMLYLDYGRESGGWTPNRYGGKENLEAVEFLRHLNSIVEKRVPGVMMIAEESTSWAGVSRPVDKEGLGFTHKWNMGWMNDFLFYIAKEPVYRRYHHNNLTFGLVYAYTENFILTLSHDEVVHGKASLLNKMPGDDWQRFANLRLTYGFMFGHPGKKLLFMGGEFGQEREWSEGRSLDWDVREQDPHAKMSRFVRDLNRLYAEESALWLDDFAGKGFEWIECNDADKSILSFMRYGKTPEDTLIFVCNFTPVPRLGHRVGVPYNRTYQEKLNSDSREYGGGGIVNAYPITPAIEIQDGRPLCLTLDLPPLGVVVLK